LCRPPNRFRTSQRPVIGITSQFFVLRNHSVAAMLWDEASRAREKTNANPCGDRASSEGRLGIVSDYPAVGIASSICIPRGSRPGAKCALFQVRSLVLLLGVPQFRVSRSDRCGRYYHPSDVPANCLRCRCWFDGGIGHHSNFLAVVCGAYAPGSVVSGKRIRRFFSQGQHDGS